MRVCPSVVKNEESFTHEAVLGHLGHSSDRTPLRKVIYAKGVGEQFRNGTEAVRYRSAEAARPAPEVSCEKRLVHRAPRLGLRLWEVGMHAAFDHRHPLAVADHQLH